MPAPPQLIATLIQQAWEQHYRQPGELVDRGMALVDAAGEGTRGAAQGWLHVAWGRRFRGEVEAAQQALQRAQRLGEQFGDAAVLANVRDLQAMIWNMARRWADALALLALNEACPPGLRSAYERGMSHQRRAAVLDQLGRRDDALRERYAMLACARETGDEAMQGLALGMLGGQHADLYNLEEAERLCAEGAAMAERSGAFQAWTMASLNRLNALVALRRGAEGLPVVQALEAAEPRMNQRAREQRLIVYADVYSQAGDHARAQALLDQSRALRNEASESLLSWTTAQVLVFMAQGQAERARAEADAFLARRQHGTDPGVVPSEQLRLLQGLGRACEALGDAPAALACEREAFSVYEALMGSGAQARRLSLEIEHQLERERWQREQAQQAQATAEAERTRLDALNHALEAASLAKTRFLAAASHDLRQPVQALAMYMAALQRESEPAAVAALVERMGQSLNALTRMFEVLLDISRLDAGTVAATPQWLDLTALLQRLHDEHGGLAAPRGVQLRLLLPAAGRSRAAFVHADPVLLERCVRNLLDNAIKYTPAGTVWLRLRPLRGGALPGWRIDIVDTGIGMDEATLARCFEEFYQADNAERDRSRGLGLGLAIVQRLAALLGLAIQLHSRPGRGTRARLQLMQAAAGEGEPAADEGHATPRPLHAGAAPAERALTLMVLDDDAAVRDSLCSVLTRWGHRCLAAADPGELLQHWQAEGRPPVHALLVDLRLRAGLDGVVAAQALRQQLGSALPVLVISGDIAPERLQLLQSSGLPWLPKPVMPMRLRSWLAGLQDGGGATIGA